MKANEKQVGGTHYQNRGGIQHWDFASARQYDYFQGVMSKYIDRWKDKNGLEDLLKCRHYLDKYIEEVVAGNIKPNVITEKHIDAMESEGSELKWLSLFNDGSKPDHRYTNQD